MSTAARSAEPTRLSGRTGRGHDGGRQWLTLGGLAALGAASLISPDRVEDGPVLCPTRLLAGLPCPGCGLVRAWVHGLHGRWAESLAAHPFGLLSVVVVAGFVAAALGARLAPRPTPARAATAAAGGWGRRYARWFGGVVAVAWIGFALARAAGSG